MEIPRRRVQQQNDSGRTGITATGLPTAKTFRQQTRAMPQRLAVIPLDATWIAGIDHATRVSWQEVIGPAAGRPSDQTLPSTVLAFWDALDPARERESWPSWNHALQL